MRKVYTLIVLLVLAKTVAAEEIKGTVTEVYNGSIFKIRSNQIRLLGVDVPVLNSGGNVSKVFLEKLLLNKEVVASCPILEQSVDGKDQWVCTVLSEGKDVSLETLSHGKSFIKKDDYIPEPFDIQYYAAERNAKSDKKGIWSY